MSCNCSAGACSTGKCICNTMKLFNILLIIGGLNWGLVGVGMLIGTNLNIVNMFLGSMPVVESVIYIVVGVSALIKMVGCRCSKCKGACCASGDTSSPVSTNM